jgi:hypothetical protein
MSVAQITQFAPGDDKINVTDVKNPSMLLCDVDDRPRWSVGLSGRPRR